MFLNLHCVKSILSDIFKTFIFYSLLCLATFLMARTILLYAGFETNVAFLQQKQEYLPIMTWRIAFYIHVFSSIFCLVAGFTQFSGEIQQKYKKLHRAMGRLYVGNILLVNFPAALIMAYYANGFLPSKTAFFILDILWFYFTLRAFIDIRKGAVQSHKNYMIRSYALTLSAITLRSWKLILSNTLTIDPVTLYMIDAWLGFVPNLLVAEYIIYRNARRAGHLPKSML